MSRLVLVPRQYINLAWQSDFLESGLLYHFAVLGVRVSATTLASTSTMPRLGLLQGGWARKRETLVSLLCQLAFWQYINIAW